MKVLELYSGIGGMHLALSESGIPGEVVVSMEINNMANIIYKHNFPNTKLINLNIEGLTSQTIIDLDIDTILMSPPCQPFTRNGLQGDIKDPRTASFLNILNILPETNVKNVLIENVKGFENSEMRNILVDTLKNNSFVYQEFLLSPSQFGIPNSRLRYYCLAKKEPDTFMFETGNIKEELAILVPSTSNLKIGDMVDKEADVSKYLLPDKILQRYTSLLDICTTDSKRSCCFTKAYSRFVEGTGSVFTDLTEDEVADILEKLKSLTRDTEPYLLLARSLNLRFFTPKEICRLMSFPESFNFPKNITDKQKYRVLGNSINVKVVAYLIKLLNYFFLFTYNSELCSVSFYFFFHDPYESVYNIIIKFYLIKGAKMKYFIHFHNHMKIYFSENRTEILIFLMTFYRAKKYYLPLPGNDQ